MTKVEIVQAAFKVWGRQFYQNTSLSSLAKELKVSKPALYRHFRNKEALTAAMLEHFFDEFAAFIKADFDKITSYNNANEVIFTVTRGIAYFYARNEYAFIFSLINVVNRETGEQTASIHLKKRGVDMNMLYEVIQKEYPDGPLLMLLLFATLVFFMANFHKCGGSLENPPSDDKIQEVIKITSEIIAGGLVYESESINALNYEELENRITSVMHKVEDDPLLRAVAEAVAEAGPWEASMDMVARRSGLSKSSLYGHFKNKQDMLAQLFITEFKRILDFARQGIAMSTVAAEQLYLGIFAVAEYLRSRTDILVAMDWIRMRKTNFGKRKEPPGFLRLFEDIKTGSLPGGSGGEDEKRQISHWILFLLINLLMRKEEGQSLGSVQNSDIRTLYRFVTMGIRGFKR